MTDQKHGRQFEKVVHNFLKESQRYEPIIVHRFSDTRAARVNYLPDQPGDFLVVSGGRAILLETKASNVHDSLRSCFSSAFTSGQAGHHRLWQRAGASTFILFYSVLTDTYEIWNGETVLEYRTLGRPLPKKKATEYTGLAQFKRAMRGLTLAEGIQWA